LTSRLRRDESSIGGTTPAQALLRAAIPGTNSPPLRAHPHHSKSGIRLVATAPKGRSVLDSSIISSQQHPTERRGDMAETTKTSTTPDGEAAAAHFAAIREAAIREEPKHRRLLRSSRDGRILSALMLPLIAIRPPAGYAVLTTTGRKSGKRRRKCIRAIRRGDKVFIVQLRPPALAIERPDIVSGWVWNLRANPDVRLRLGSRTYAGIAREIDQPAELEQAREAICETVHLTDYDECALHVRGFPTRGKIRALHRYWFDTGIPLVIELSD
jgi:deazaflavin-dependent oxidoreductase (nitroreductase family)